MRHLTVGQQTARLGARTFAAFLTASLACSPPLAGSDGRTSAPVVEQIHLSKKLKGHLPITELTEDQAILHALNRLAYGPRPGDVERIRQMGLEKWIEGQLHPEAIDDSFLEQRLGEFKTLRMSAEQLLEKYPPPNQVAKREGMTPE